MAMVRGRPLPLDTRRLIEKLAVLLPRGSSSRSGDRPFTAGIREDTGVPTSSTFNRVCVPRTLAARSAFLVPSAAKGADSVGGGGALAWRRHAGSGLGNMCHSDRDWEFRVWTRWGMVLHICI